MKVVARWTTLVAIAVAFASTAIGPVAVAAPTSPSDPTPPPAATNSALTSEEKAAVATAARTGKPAAVESLTTEYSTTVANPSGGFTFTSSRVPQRVKKNSAWTPINTALATGADGRIRPSAALSDVSFSAGGNGPLTVTSNQGVDVTVTLATRLPAPSISGDTITYSEVLAGVDLQLTATATGYTQVWVAKNAQAAANPALKKLTSNIDVTGATATVNPDGSVVVGPADKPILTAGAPTAWDSTPSAGDKNTKATAKTPGDGQRAITPSMTKGGSTKNKNGATATSYTQTLTVPDTMLTNPATQYPLYIDPPWSTTRAHFKVVTNLGYTYADNTDVLRVGYCRYTGCYNFGNTSYYLARSYVSFDLSALNVLRGGQRPTITSANVNTHQTYNAAGSATTINLKAATGLPTGWGGSASTTLASAAIAGDTYVNLGGASVASNLQGTINAGATSATFAYTSDETIGTGNISWKKLANDPVLQVNYTYPPNTPTNFAVDSSGCGTQRVVNSPRPTFRMSASDDLNRLHHVTVQIFSGNALVGTVAPSVTANGLVAYQWPSALADGAYTAQASTTNLDAVSSAWTSAISFTVSTAQPSQAPAINQPNPSGRTVLVVSPVAVAGFSYGWGSQTNMPVVNDPCTENVVSPDGGYRVASRYVTTDLNGNSASAGWAAEIPAPPALLSTTTVYVKSYTSAGNALQTPVTRAVTLTDATKRVSVFQAESLTPAMSGLTASSYTAATPNMVGTAVAFTPTTTCPTLTSTTPMSSSTCYVDLTVPVPGPAASFNSAEWQIQINGVVTGTSARAKFSFPTPTFTPKNDSYGFVSLARLADASGITCSSIPCSEVQTVSLASKTTGGLAAPSTLTIRVYPMSNAPVVIDSITMVGTVIETAPAAGAFIPTSSVRVLDTRTTTALAAGTATMLQITGKPIDGGVVPATASAALVNLTVVSPQVNGWLAAYASTAAYSGTSNINFLAGQDIANLAVVPIGTGGKIAILNGSAGPLHVVVDLVGYYAGGAATSPGAYKPLARPFRLLNSGSPYFSIGANGTMIINPSVLTAGAPADQQIPANAGSLMINVAFIPTSIGYGSVQPSAHVNTAVSNQNYGSAGMPVAALISTGLDSGTIALFNASPGGTALVIDVLGYTIGGTPGTSPVGMFVPVPHTRVFETRNSSTGLQAPLGNSEAILLGTPAVNGPKASGIVTTAIITNATAPGFITTQPGNVQPSGSTLNFAAGQTISNLNITKTSPQGTVSYQAALPGTVDLIVDIAGYYTSGS